jgi:uncharacterized Zn-finger protein
VRPAETVCAIPVSARKDAALVKRGAMRTLAAENRSIMTPFETITVDTWVVGCDGGGSAVAGHPKVYLNLSGHGKVECPYCSRLFVHKGADGHGAAVVTAGAAGELQAKPGDRQPPTAPGHVPGPAASPATQHAASPSSSPAKP